MIKRANNHVEILADGWPATGLLRIDQIIGVGRLPISKSQFWVLVRQRSLTPVKISPRVTCFFVHELRAKLLGVPADLNGESRSLAYANLDPPPTSVRRGGRTADCADIPTEEKEQKYVP